MGKAPFLLLILLSLIVVLPAASAQESVLGEEARQESVEVNISEDGKKMFVTHIVGPSGSPQQLELMEGTVINLAATDEDGNEKQVAVVGNDDAVLILPSRTDSIVSYELGDVLEFEGSYWTLDFLYLESIKFFMPEDIESVYVNDQRVVMGDKKGFVCHGCQMTLEYSLDEPRVLQSVEWEEHEFDVEIISLSKVDDFVFDQPGKSLTFGVSKENRFLTVVIPLELLWEPYAVFLDGKQIRVSSIDNNGTHVSLHIRPDASGEISIVGTTVVPEFPAVASLATIGLLTILTLPLVRKLSLR